MFVTSLIQFFSQINQSNSLTFEQYSAKLYLIFVLDDIVYDRVYKYV